MRSKQKSRQVGVTLIEVLITMVVVAVGLLGAAGLQLASTKFQQTSALRTLATQKAEIIIEKMRVNNANFTLANLASAVAAPETAYLAADDYASATVLPAYPACGLQGQPVCTAAQAAQRDLREWREMLARELPAGRGSIFPIAAAGGATEANTRRVVVMWREKAGSEVATEGDLAAEGITRLDPECPVPREPFIRCLNLLVTP
jgi:type IV pilus assembly protein PilV